ncbi:alpha/beta fold hydrolase [Sphingomonas sp.]|uniref:alpha/beta hydrolase n=1 Tax=Sphingomonas sp. TaxID=28214 RepID=UPI0025CBF540|nr:alpha/beta fold hydrolase [Sphingomonas sp.]
MIRSMLLSAMLAAAATPAGVEVTVPGPQGPLAGTLIDPGKTAPAILIIPGSGPTDRDGNNPLGVKGGVYRQLAEGLSAKGIATLRIDKRGMFGSKGAIADANDVTIAAYAADAHAWVDMLRAKTGRKCVWLLGHSEGSLVALKAAQDPKGICGVILVSGAGRPYGEVIRAQLRANPANAPLLAAGEAALDQLEAGKRVDGATLPAPLQPLFRDNVQGFLIEAFSYDPAKLAGAIKLPVLILQGDKDLQVAVTDAELLKRGQPAATLKLLPGVNHVLKPVDGDDRAANAATYGNADLAISPAVPEAIAAFVRK